MPAKRHMYQIIQISLKSILRMQQVFKMFINPSELAGPPWSLLIKRAVAHLELHQGQGEGKQEAGVSCGEVQA